MRTLAAALLICLGPLAWGQGAPASDGGDRFETTLRRDIAGASYYELVSWCRELGLEDAGTRTALASRLLRHYGLAEAGEKAAAEARIEVISARQTDYFTLELVGEEYVVLRGGVVVKVRDRGRDSVHTVESEYLLYNRTTGEMTASGGARYVLSKGGKDEVFEGESLSFDTASLEGVFYDGSVQRERTSGGRTLTFTFRGAAISRLANDTIILEDGTVTSSRAAEPYYAVRARRAWILADGEWAVLGATLDVGRVPLAWLPFFFYPGDELLFHPNLELRTREGTALQTTTYLVGQRKRGDDALSLLNLSQESGSGYRRVRRGLFLTVDPDRATPVTDRSLTLMADVYSRLGAMVGLDARFAPDYTGRIGIGVSRSIFRDSTGAYTPYYDDPELGYVSVWNHSAFLGTQLPIRFGVESTFRLQAGIVGATGSVELYSDPYFPQDFYNRSDRLKWDSLLGGAAAASGATSAGTKANLSWTASANANFARLVSSPAATELAVRAVDLGAFIGSRTVDTAGSALLAADPARSFYYPVSAKIPSISLGARGTLLSLPARPKAAAKTSAAAKAPAGQAGGAAPARDNPGKGIRVPWEDAAEEAAEEAPEAPESPEAPRFGARLERELEGPARRADVAVSTAAAASSLEVTYSVTPRGAVEVPFDSAAWRTSADVDLATASVNLSGQSDARIGLNLSLRSRLVVVPSEVQASGTARTRVPGSAEVGETEWRRLLLSDYQATKLTISERTSVTVQPLLGVEAWKSSTVSYTFGWQLLGTSYSTLVDDAPVYVTTAGTIDRDSVSAHSLSAALTYKPDLLAQSLTLTAVLPPEEVSLRAQAAFAIWKLTARAGLGVRYADPAWRPDPVTASATLQPWPWLTASQEAGLDFLDTGSGVEQPVFTRLVSTVKLANLSTTFTAQRTAPVNPYGTATGEPPVLLPSLLQVQVSLPSQKGYMWRNRIGIEADLRSGWTWNLQRFTQNELTFSASLSLSVHKFMTLVWSAESYNNRMYRYFPAYAEELGIDWVNPVYDLLRSFNFLDSNDRYLSAFKVRKLSVSLVHNLEDWDFRAEYQGKPALRTLSDGTKQYEWSRSLSLSLEWRPLQLLRARASATDTTFTFGG